jgi:hypothetical protein
MNNDTETQRIELDKKIDAELRYICRKIVDGVVTDSPLLDPKDFMIQKQTPFDVKITVDYDGRYHFYGFLEYRELVFKRGAYITIGHNHVVYFTKEEAEEVVDERRDTLPARLSDGFILRTNNEKKK